MVPVPKVHRNKSGATGARGRSRTSAAQASPAATKKSAI